MKPAVVDNSPQISAPAEQAAARSHVTFNQRMQYWAALAVLKTLGWLPHKLARGVGALLAAVGYWLWPRLRRVGLFNLRLAFPEWTERQRRRVIYGLFQNFGRMLADYAHFPRWNRDNIENLIIYDGFENYAHAQSQGRGVLFLTAHFGNWELGSFAHGLYGYPCHFVVREMDNPLIDRQERICAGSFAGLCPRTRGGRADRSEHDVERRRFRRLLRHSSLHHYG